MLRSSGMVRAGIRGGKNCSSAWTAGHRRPRFFKPRSPSGRRSLNYFDIHGIGIAFCDAAVTLIARLCGAKKKKK